MTDTQTDTMTITIDEGTLMLVLAILKAERGTATFADAHAAIVAAIKFLEGTWPDQDITEKGEEDVTKHTSEDEFWEDAKGNRVRLANISQTDQMKDELARRLVEGAKGVQRVMSEFKKGAFEEVMAAKGLIFEKYGVALGGKKGNISIKSFDGSCEVQVAVADLISFGPELQAAKALIDECIEDWSEGANDNIRTLVEDAFQVNKAGRIDTGRVFALRRLDMKDKDTGAPDPRWVRAMDAIADAVQVDGSATYVRFYDRAGVGAVTLDFAKL